MKVKHKNVGLAFGACVAVWLVSLLFHSLSGEEAVRFLFPNVENVGRIEALISIGSAIFFALLATRVLLSDDEEDE